MSKNVTGKDDRLLLVSQAHVTDGAGESRTFLCPSRQDCRDIPTHASGQDGTGRQHASSGIGDCRGLAAAACRNRCRGRSVPAGTSGRGTRGGGGVLRNLHVNFKTVESYMVTYKEVDHRLIAEARNDLMSFCRIRHTAKWKRGGKGGNK